MEAPRLTDDEVRDLFSQHHDRELDPEKSEAVRAAIEDRPALKREYESFCAMLNALGALGEEPPKGAPSTPPKVDILRGVQGRLNKRSRGKFYGDQWSRVAGLFPVEVLAVLVLVALVAAYLAMGTINVRPTSTPQSPHSGQRDGARGGELGGSPGAPGSR